MQGYVNDPILVCIVHCYKIKDIDDESKVQLMRRNMFRAYHILKSLAEESELEFEEFSELLLFNIMMLLIIICCVYCCLFIYLFVVFIVGLKKTKPLIEEPVIN